MTMPVRSSSWLLPFFLVACSGAAPAPDSAAPPPATSAFVLTNARLPGGDEVELFVMGGRFVSPGTIDDGAPRVDAEDAFVVPAIIDAHVHLAYLPVEAAHAAGGVAGAVDLASPLNFLDSEVGALRLRRAGPMITASAGYPTRSWGSDGYGLECDAPEACADAVRELSARGADLIKVPLTAEPTLDDASLVSVVEAAHARGLRVAAHALTEEAARRAASAGVDILAHTPTEALSDEAVAALSDAIIISTLGAFGGGPIAVDNLARLRRAGATIAYGTDLGNTRAPGIDPRELVLLASAGLDEAAILEAMTQTPAEVFGFSELGTLDVGKAASFILLPRDPLDDIVALASPAAVFLDGRQL